MTVWKWMPNINVLSCIQKLVCFLKADRWLEFLSDENNFKNFFWKSSHHWQRISVTQNSSQNLFTCVTYSTCLINSVSHGGCPRGVMVKAMVCEIEAREFELKSCYYVHFRTNKVWTPISSQLFFKENCFGIKQRNQTKPNHQSLISRENEHCFQVGK